MSNDFGIARIGFGHPWYLGYAARGFGRRWPYWAKRAVVTTWNRGICLFNGHVPIDDEDEHVPCVHCGKRA